MAEVRWTKLAVEDIEAIRDFISRDSSHYGSLVAEHLVNATDRLEAFPRSGRVVPEFGDESMREILWGSYRIVYRCRGDVVEIVTVYHGARPLPEVLR